MTSKRTGPTTAPAIHALLCPEDGVGFGCGDGGDVTGPENFMKGLEIFDICKEGR